MKINKCPLPAIESVLLYMTTHSSDIYTYISKTEKDLQLNVLELIKHRFSYLREYQCSL